jgi:chromosomal replication initiator protein
MQTTQTEQWQACLDILKNRIGADRFNLWFKNIELVEFSDTQLVIGVSSAFIAEWLEEKLKQDIVDSLYAVCGEPREVKFRVAASLFGKLRAESLEESASLIRKATAEKASVAQKDESQVRPEFTLSGFVVGPCNQLAFAAAKDLVSSVKVMINPLFLHGPTGVGKTHLLQAIYNELAAVKPQLRVRYAHAERFTNQYVFGLKHGRLDGFRHLYRDADVLLIDDVHFLSNKMGFQEEFLHTFNAVVGRSHQVVMASDSHPHELAKIHEGLASRFMSGMVVKLEPPQYSTRLAILRSKAARLQKRIDEDVFKFIAHMCQGNVRDLEGALTTVLACASLSGGKVDVDMAKQVLQRCGGGRKGPISLGLLEHLALEEFGMTREQLHARKRAKCVSIPRQVCMYLARKWTGASAQEIGDHFGGRNHTTVLFAEKKIGEAVTADQSLAYHIQQIDDRLQARHHAR